MLNEDWLIVLFGAVTVLTIIMILISRVLPGT